MISLRRIKAIECYLSGAAAPHERLLHQARMLVDCDLQRDTRLQQQVYEAVRAYGRKQLRNNIKAVEEQLFTDSTYADFQQQIKQIFD
jgi:lipoate-protein ligase A